MNKNQVSKQGFKDRYNRDVEVEQGADVDSNGNVSQTRNIFRFKNKEYIIEEYLKNNLTDYCLMKYKNKTHKYRTYLEAEVCVADLIGKDK